MHKGHYGQYTGNARHSRVTDSNMGATKRDDEAHMKYLKEDIDYDNKHGHSDENMTADEKHISKLAGDLKYDEKHHGSPAHIEGSQKDHGYSNKEFEEHEGRVGTDGHSPVKAVKSAGRSGHPRHMQAGADNSGNPNAASADEYWRVHQQARHHQSAPQKQKNN